MKLITSCLSKTVVTLSIFLMAPVLTVHGQENRVLENHRSLPSGTMQIVDNTSARAPSSVAARPKSENTPSQNNGDAQTVTTGIGDRAGDQWTWIGHEGGLPPQKTANQGATNNGYVFPTSNERFRNYLWDTFGPPSLIGIGAAAGYDQSQNDPPEWKQGASGYGKRYASRLGQYAIEQTVTYGLSEAFRLDSGFHKSTRKGFSERLPDALIQNITSRTRSGKRLLSAPHLAGAYVGGIIPAVTWYPSRFSYKDGLREGTYSLAIGFGVNVVREFIFRR